MERANSNRWLGRATAVAALCALASGACVVSHPAPAAKPGVVEKSPEPKARGGGPVSLKAAADLITYARCGREKTCNRVGPGHRFNDDHSCRQELIHAARKEMSTATCETGFVEATALRECLDAIRAGDCHMEVGRECEPTSMCSP